MDNAIMDNAIMDIAVMDNVVADRDTNFGGYEVPVDPMDLLQCDSCQ